MSEERGGRVPPRAADLDGPTAVDGELTAVSVWPLYVNELRVNPR
jgi:hypothetical protein